MSKGQFLSRGKLGALTLASAAALVLVLAGCQGPTGPLHIQEARTGTVTLSFSPEIVGRAIMPDFSDWGNLLYRASYLKVVFTPDNGDAPVVVGPIPANGADTNIERVLEHGVWEVVVIAFEGGDYTNVPFDGVLIAQSVPYEFTLNTASHPIGDVYLVPVMDDYVDGFFSWDLTVDSALTGAAPFADVTYSIVLVPRDGGPSLGPFTGCDGTEEVPVGFYVVTITATNDDEYVATLVEYLRVFSGLTSVFAHEFWDNDFVAPPSVTVSIDGAVTSPTAFGGGTATVTADTVPSSATVTWSLQDPVDGVSVDPITGVVTIDIGTRTGSAVIVGTITVGANDFTDNVTVAWTLAELCDYIMDARELVSTVETTYIRDLAAMFGYSQASWNALNAARENLWVVANTVPPYQVFMPNPSDPSYPGSELHDLSAVLVRQWIDTVELARENLAPLTGAIVAAALNYIDGAAIMGFANAADTLALVGASILGTLDLTDTVAFPDATGIELVIEAAGIDLGWDLVAGNASAENDSPMFEIMRRAGLNVWMGPGGNVATVFERTVFFGYYPAPSPDPETDDFIQFVSIVNPVTFVWDDAMVYAGGVLGTEIQGLLEDAADPLTIAVVGAWGALIAERANTTLQDAFIAAVVDAVYNADMGEIFMDAFIANIISQITAP